MAVQFNEQAAASSLVLLGDRGSAKWYDTVSFKYYQTY